MDIITLPPVNLSPVTDTSLSWQHLEAQEPVDFSATLDGQGWSAEIIIRNCGDEAYREAVTLTAEGGVSVIIPQAISAKLRSQRQIDAQFQIRFTAPLPDFDMTWRGPVVVLEIFE